MRPMRYLTIILTAVLIPALSFAGPQPIAEVHRSARIRDVVTVEGVITDLTPYFAQIHDKTAGIKVFYANSAPAYAVGDIVRVTGRVERMQDLPSEKCIRYDLLEKRGRDPDLCRPLEIAARDLQNSHGLDFCLVSISGIVTRVFQDDFDPRYVFLCFAPVGCRAFAAIQDPDRLLRNSAELIDAEVRVTGTLSRQSTSRQYLGPHVVALSPAAVQIVKPPLGDPFDAPAYSDDTFRAIGFPDAEPTHRQRVSGTVLATWGGNAFFLVSDDGSRMRIYLDPSCAPPAPGDAVTVSGFPSHTMFFPRFVNSVCRIDRRNDRIGDETPVNVVPHDLLADAQDQSRVQLKMDGRLLRLKGKVVLCSETEDGRRTLHLSSGGQTFRIEAGDLPVPPVGAEIEATGICLFFEEATNVMTDSPRIGGFVLVPRHADDIRTLRNPPWLTPLRAAVILGSLILLLVLGVVWNLMLQKLVARRGRQLARESLAHLKAELRIDERTRLAVELHDSLSQNLSGLACQITSVKRVIPETAVQAASRLDIAERMLTSSRTELKRCLWDLRGDTLECKSMEDAIRNTIQPVIGESACHIRFSVSRARMTDSILHSILCIIRELVSNAIRHGRARNIHIAGALDGNALLFSVRDDGAGFDVAHHQGIADGHFGLEGIRERIDRLNGDFRLESAPGHGSSARIRIPLPSQSDRTTS